MRKEPGMSDSSEPAALVPLQPDAAPKAVVAGEFRPVNVDPSVDSAWLDRVSMDGVAYALPDGLTSSLQRDLRFQKAAASLPNERELWSQCVRSRAVGLLGSRPLAFPYLAGMETPPASASSATAQWSDESRRALQIVEHKASEVRERLKGYLGWLVTEPLFLEERNRLRTAWRQLPASQTPGFPLQRVPRVLVPLPDTRPAAELTAPFLATLDAFLSKWSLASLATWELPVPAGPLIPDLLPASGRALEQAVVRISLPAHYPLQGSDALLQEIREHQRSLAADQGIPDPVGHMSHYIAYGQMFEVAFWEEVLRRRFEDLRLKGFVSMLEAAIASHLGISVDQVKKHRDAISRCRRGLRHKVPHLKVKG